MICKAQKGQVSYGEPIGVLLLDAKKVKQEVVSTVQELTMEDPKVKAILLECSLLPPYGAAGKRQ